jgi:hypothetical protein
VEELAEFVDVESAPSLVTTYAQTRSPTIGSGIATTAAIAIRGCPAVLLRRPVR